MSMGGQWMNKAIIDGDVSGSAMTGQELNTIEEKIRISIDPIGQYTYKLRIKRRSITMDPDVAGNCEVVDSSALKGRES